MQNGITNYFYTIWAKKNTHTNLCIIVHLCTVAMVTITCVFVILLISVRTFFFSLFSVHNQRTQFSSPHLLFPQMHTNKHTHTHTQTNSHKIRRDVRLSAPITTRTTFPIFSSSSSSPRYAPYSISNLLRQLPNYRFERHRLELKTLCLSKIQKIYI